MLPSATSQAPGISPLPGVSPSAMMTAAAARDEDSIFGAGADETFFSSIGALVASPPPSSHGTSPDLRWPCSADGAAGLLACERVAKPSPSTQEIFDNSGAAAAEGPFSLPLVASSIPSGQSLGPPRPMLHPGSSADPVGGIEPMAPAEAPATGTSPPPPRPSAPAASRAKKLPGLSKSRAKGGGTRQARKSKSGTSNAAAAAARQEAGLEDGEPDNIVCLLAVGSKTQQLARADVSGGGGGGGNNNDGSSTVAGNAASLADTVKMLTVEMGRNGRELETEHVETGQRAVLQVEALARCDMRFGMVVLEVEESLVAAAETAGELRAANRSTPIVAVAPPHLLLASPPPLARKYFNEILQFPISAAKVRGLATRWLLQPPSCAAAAATSGMVGEPVDPDPTAWTTATQHAGSGSTTAATTITTLVVPSPPAVAAAAGGAPLQQQQPVVNRAPEILGKPRASMPSSLPPSASSAGKSERLPPPIGGRVFGGGAEDRASPCRLFGEEFEKQNAEMEVREYDFMFRHGTILLRVEEDELGETSTEVFSACEYATGHFGNITGKSLESMFESEFPATNKDTSRKILEHIKKSDTDNMCSYINLKSEVGWMTSSFVSLRSLSRRPVRGPGIERLPPWYVILKVCLPSTLGLIKEPELLETMYSKKAAALDKTERSLKQGSRKAAPKRSAKKAKVTPAGEDDNNEDDIADGASN